MLGIPDVFFGALLALAATAAGAAGLLLVKSVSRIQHCIILAFSSGVMLYAAAEMLLQSYFSGWENAAIGFACGGAALFLLEKLIPHAHAFVRGRHAAGISNEGKKAVLIGGTITLHNIPEGFAIASAFAASSPLGWLVSVSIAVQDVPEGLIVSAPLAAYGVSRKTSVFWGIFSGVVEAAAAVAGFVFIAATASITPLALAFSAGAMAFVTFFELLPDAFSEAKKRMPTIALAAGLVGAALIAFLLAVKPM